MKSCTTIIAVAACLCAVSCEPVEDAGTRVMPYSYAYVLQADAKGNTRKLAAERFSKIGRKLLVLDPVFGGDNGERWDAEDLKTIRSAPSRKVVAYLSIGEAEDYRDYWQSKWDADSDGTPDKDAPVWLLKENPDWKGNYRVKYWSTEWQKIVFGQLDSLIAQGFDGAWLDIVDAFEGFEQNGKEYIDNRKNPATGNSYREDMIAFVIKLANHSKKQNAHFMIIPQNGIQLLSSKRYVSTIDALALEDVFTDGKRIQPTKHTEYIMSLATPIMATGKPVFVTEYAKNATAVDALKAAAAKHPKLTILLTDRPLKTDGKMVEP